MDIKGEKMIKLIFKDGHVEYIDISTIEFEATYEDYMTDEVEYAENYNIED